MKLSFIIICSFLVGSEGLHILPAPLRDGVSKPQKQECSNDTHWGIWKDGKDDLRSEYFHGKHYAQTFDPALKDIYARVELLEPGLELFKDIADLLHESFRKKVVHQGLTLSVSKCLKTFKKEKFNEIMEDVVVVNKHFKSKDGETSGEQISQLFEEYNQRQKLAAGQPEKQIKAIGFLVHNLAFAHPLKDHNGRMRMILIQHELRRLQLGCGAMLYNNNRDMCFNTPTETADKIKEGMSIYDQWQKTGVNPWTEPANQEKHLASFPVSKALKSCWQKTGVTHSGHS